MTVDILATITSETLLAAKVAYKPGKSISILTYWAVVSWLFPHLRNLTKMSEKAALKEGGKKVTVPCDLLGPCVVVLLYKVCLTI